MKRNGFTLIELMVVVSILIVLISILFPAIQHAQMVSRQRTSRALMGLVEAGIFQYKETFKVYPESKRLYNQLTGWRMGPARYNPGSPGDLTGQYESWGYRKALRGQKFQFVDEPDRMKICLNESGKAMEIDDERFFTDVWNNPMFYGLSSEDGETYTMAGTTYTTENKLNTKDINDEEIDYLKQARTTGGPFILATSGSNSLWGKYSSSPQAWGEGTFDSDEKRYEAEFNDVTNFND
ncbi:MAG: type II secretion system protein [Phycisphaerales bacterium]|nr:type II secretion system protein [Phycisphaerales bacterium]MBT7170350.1 type II secretion system protein [Phycisphaerales bacterium]